MSSYRALYVGVSLNAVFNIFATVDKTYQYLLI